MTSVFTKRAHHSGRRIMRANIGGRIVLLPDAKPEPERPACLDPDCKTTTDTHDAECAVDMGADSMHERFLAGARVGVW